MPALYVMKPLSHTHTHTHTPAAPARALHVVVSIHRYECLPSSEHCISPSAGQPVYTSILNLQSPAQLWSLTLDPPSNVRVQQQSNTRGFHCIFHGDGLDSCLASKRFVLEHSVRLTLNVLCLSRLLRRSHSARHSTHSRTSSSSRSWPSSARGWPGCG